MTSSPVVAAVFYGEDAVARIRQAMGVTDPSKAEAGTIRADFGLDVTRNAVHGSDSVETAEQRHGAAKAPSRVPWAMTLLAPGALDLPVGLPDHVVLVSCGGPEHPATAILHEILPDDQAEEEARFCRALAAHTVDRTP